MTVMPTIIRASPGKPTRHFQLGPNVHAALEHWSGGRFRTQFVLRFPEDWFFSFVRDKDRVVRVTIANVFPGSEVGTFTRVD